MEDFHPQGIARLGAAGIAEVSGDLHPRVIESGRYVAHPISTRAVHSPVTEEHPVVVLIVVTKTNKLMDKRLLSRRDHDRAYL